MKTTKPVSTAAAIIAVLAVVSTLVMSPHISITLALVAITFAVLGTKE